MMMSISEYESSVEAPMLDLAFVVNDNAHQKGFYSNPRSFGEAIALIHSELSEALEEDREGRAGLWFQGKDGQSYTPLEVYVDSETGLVYSSEDRDTTQLPLKPEGRDIELVDALIRIFDTLAENDADIDALVSLKMGYNATRGFLHGKAY